MFLGFGVLGGQDVEALQAQKALEHCQIMRLIVDNEDAAGARNCLSERAR